MCVKKQNIFIRIRKYFKCVFILNNKYNRILSPQLKLKILITLNCQKHCMGDKTKDRMLAKI